VRLQKDAYKEFLQHKIRRTLRPRAVLDRVRRYRSVESIRSDAYLLKRFLQIVRF
jgi:hypothetical protein